MRITIAFIALVLIGCSGVQFQPMALYDHYETLPEKELTSAVIYEEGAGTMWNSLFECGDFEITKEEAYSGNSSIKLSWNKGTCEWIGFGNSWNNWVPTDLTNDRFKLALSFYAKTQEKTAKAIPIVAALEDFGGGGSYYFVDAGKYLRGLELDSTWKQIIVPLWHFPVFEDEVDISAIKQMQFQLEGSGSFYLDQIEVIPYSKEEYAAHRAEVELLRPKGNPNQIIYTEGRFIEDAWGYVNKTCQELNEITEKNGNVCIQWKYEAEECSWAKWGINWNGWYASNFRGLDEKCSISFKIKATESAKFRMILQDFRGHSADIITEANLTSKNEWQEISIPISQLDLKGKQFSIAEIKQIWFDGKNSGTVWIDDFKIIENK